MNSINRIQELIKLCNYHSNLYYTQDKPQISDKEYDKLYSELESLEAETNYVLSSSPTQKVQGEVLPFLAEVQHTEPMLSADKSKDINDVLKFMGDQECVLSWKLDGLSIILKYNNSKFYQAITRGGGASGEDVTHTVKTFANIPLTVDYKDYLEIRGEGLVPFKDFERINSELISKGEEPYASPRNLAAGSTRQLDANITKIRNLVFIAFGIVKCDKEFKTKVEQFEFLKSLGFETVFYNVIDKSVISESVELFKEKVLDLPYLTDGLIIEYNDIAYGKAQGSTNHHSNALYALKWSNENYETTLTGIELNTKRTGITSITGLFKTVDMSGAKVSRATLHNYDIFESLQLGIGDTITVYRANQVIPQLEDNLTRSGTYKIDMHCPSCGNELIIKQPKDARFLFCVNENCPSKLVDKFVHFCNKNGMNIDGLSEATLEKFINKGFIKTFSDIYKLDQYKSEIINLDGFGIKSYNKLIKAIEKSKNIKFENFVYALGIDQIGKGGSRQLAKHFDNDINSFLNSAKSYLSYINVQDFGKITSSAVYEYLFNKDNINQINELLKYVNIVKSEEKKPTNTIDDNPFKGKKAYGTGTFANYKKEELKTLIESLGCEFTSGYAKSLDYLIVGSLKGSGKEDKAKEDGVKILGEFEFMKMIGKE
jgi:DNA ligase (NAD+)